MRNDKGQSPLDIALVYLYEGCMDVALYLMSRGCGSDEDNNAKLLCAACRCGKLDVVKKLVEQDKVDPKSECHNVHVPYIPAAVTKCFICWQRRLQFERGHCSREAFISPSYFNNL